MYYYLFAFVISEHSLYLLIIICRAGDGVWEEGKVEGWNMNTFLPLKETLVTFGT